MHMLDIISKRYPKLFFFLLELFTCRGGIIFMFVTKQLQVSHSISSYNCLEKCVVAYFALNASQICI